MQCWKDHQYRLGRVVLAWSEEYLKLQSVQRILAVSKDARDTIFNEYFPQTDPVDPNAPPANPTAPAEKRKGWNLTWAPLSGMVDMSSQRPGTRFSLNLWMSIFCINQVHGRAYPDASSACCVSDDVLVQERCL